MMERTQRFESKTISGASFILRTVGRQLRHRAELTLAPTRHKQRMITQEQLSLLPEAVDPDGLKEQLEARISSLSKEEIERLDLLRSQKLLLLDEVRMGYVLTMLDSFSLPGEEYAAIQTKEDLLEFGPESFAEEIMIEADQMWGLTPKQSKNSQSPSTSQGPVDGATNSNDGTAPVADNAETTA